MAKERTEYRPKPKPNQNAVAGAPISSIHRYTASPCSNAGMSSPYGPVDRSNDDDIARAARASQQRSNDDDIAVAIKANQRIALSSDDMLALQATAIKLALRR